MNDADVYTRYVILLSLNPGQSLNGSLVRDHVSHLRELDRQGKLVLCGPFRDYPGGMIIIRAGSYEEADRIARNDPFVSSGTESYELRTWELSCEENNHLGAG